MDRPNLVISNSIELINKIRLNVTTLILVTFCFGSKKRFFLNFFGGGGEGFGIKRS